VVAHDQSSNLERPGLGKIKAKRRNQKSRRMGGKKKGNQLPVLREEGMATKSAGKVTINTVGVFPKGGKRGAMFTQKILGGGKQRPPKNGSGSSITRLN